MQKTQQQNVLTLIKYLKETKLERQKVIDSVASIAIQNGANATDDFFNFIVDTTQKVGADCLIQNRE